MSKDLNVSVLEMLLSKVCHDLISPIGAINNGLEILEDMGTEGSEDVVELIAFSAQQASAKLQAYRLAYGAGGADAGIKPENVHKAIEEFIGSEKKFTQSWDPYGGINFEDRPKAYGKMLTCAMLIILDSLPKGGTIKAEGNEESKTITLTGEGENASLWDYTEEAVSGLLPYQDIDPRLVHAYITGLLMRHYGYNINFTENNGDKVVLELKTP